MEAVGCLAPRLDRIRVDPQCTPVLRARRHGLLHISQMPEPVSQRSEIVDPLALARNDGLEAVSEVALREQLLGKGALRQHRPAGDVGLSPKGGPVEEQRNLRVGLDLPRLAGPQRGGERRRPSLSKRFERETVRAEGRPSTVAVTRVIAAGIGRFASRAS